MTDNLTTDVHLRGELIRMSQLETREIDLDLANKHYAETIHQIEQDAMDATRKTLLAATVFPAGYRIEKGERYLIWRIKPTQLMGSAPNFDAAISYIQTLAIYDQSQQLLRQEPYRRQIQAAIKELRRAERRYRLTADLMSGPRTNVQPS